MFACVFSYASVLTAVSVSDGEEIRVSNKFPSCTESVCTYKHIEDVEEF